MSIGCWVSSAPVSAKKLPDQEPAEHRLGIWRPAFDQIAQGYGGRFDILMVWSINRLGRSVLHVANALAELDAVVGDRQVMIQMVSVFAT